MVTGTVLHDMNFAFRFSDHLTVMHRGRSTPAGAITPEMARKIYGVEAEVCINSKGYPMVDPMSIR